MNIANLGEWAGDPLLYGIIAGLVVGKLVGVFGGAFLTARFTRAELDPSLRWIDMVGLSLVSGVGFTVSLLIADLAFEDDPADLDVAKGGILFGSLIAAFLAGVILRTRDRAYRLAEQVDDTT